MFSSVQAVFLFDVNCVSEKCKTESELEQNVAKLKLSCLKLLTEFGAQTEKGIEVVRWHDKYYDSFSYKPNTSRKGFVDFNKNAFEEFENRITEGFCGVFDRKNCRSDGDAQNGSKTHSFILKKSLQEILLDYNWDRPDISSPVKPIRRSSKRRSNSKVLPDSLVPYNTVIIFTTVPGNTEDIAKFCGFSTQKPNVDEFLGNILDTATLKGFREEKLIHLNFVAVNSLLSEDRGDGSENKVFSAINAGLAKLGGGLHLIANIVETNFSQEVALGAKNGGAGSDDASLPNIFPLSAYLFESIKIRTPWWKKGKGSRPRRPQRGPLLVWEDAEGISHIQVPLEVLAVNGSSSRSWGNAFVVAVMQNSSMSLLALAGGTGQLYVCHAPNTIFTSVIQLLRKYQLSMLLKLSCGGIAVLSPWAGDVGSLAVISASGLTIPPVYSQPSCREANAKHPSVLKFVTQTVEKCLKNAPAFSVNEAKPNKKRFAAHQTERWFRPSQAREDVIMQIKKKRTSKVERLAMQERLQKKYRPQIPRALATFELDKVDLVDITQPPTESESVPDAKPTMSRAQQLVKKAHIVTAQQKVKEQQAEEEERVQASERRAALASEQARKSQALESHVLNTVTDPQNTQELIQSLILLRDSSEKDTDCYTTAQTIINLALMHVKNSSESGVEEELYRVLGNGVLQSAADINQNYPSRSRLEQFKLQALLHLELLWLFGYSSSSIVDDEEEENRGVTMREHHMGEAVKMLRAISLTHNPATMANFMKETIVNNYAETLGEVLVEIFEELNQPLPEVLRILSGDIGSVFDARPSSVKSLASIVGLPSDDSMENPDSLKSREERRMSRHPSLRESSKPRLVVPMASRTLRRTTSEQTREKKSSNRVVSKESSNGDIQKVRRNLFDLTETVPKVKLQRSRTIAAVPVTELRRSPRKQNSSSRARRSLDIGKSEKTPVKASVSSMKGFHTPKLKKGGVLAPETPAHKIGETIFNKKRVCKSTGTTIITESPDVKRICRTTPRRLRASLTVSRRNSFYSGARSRNWERAKTQLLADHIRGNSERRSIDQNSLQNINASFLFSEILLESQSDHQDCANIGDGLKCTPERMVLDFGFDDAASCESERSDSNVKTVSGNTPAKNTRLSLVDRKRSLPVESGFLGTPTKRARRVLSLSTPSKLMADTGEAKGITVNNASDAVNTFTPKKTVKSPDINALRFRSNTCVSPDRFIPLRTNSLCEMTPSKRVQFSLHETPGKTCPMVSNLKTPVGKTRPLHGTPATPKSILKTPSKTPLKALVYSPDIFSLSKVALKTPLKTPIKGHLVNYSFLPSSVESGFSGFSDQAHNVNRDMTPVKVKNIACYEESEIELVSPSKRDKGICKASLILHNSPKKKEYGLPVEGQKNHQEDLDTSLSPNIICGKSVKTINYEEESLKASSLDNGLAVDIPYMKPEDVELIHLLMFNNFLSIEEDGTANRESTALELNNGMSSFSSPLKNVDEISSTEGDRPWVFLPDKQELQGDVSEPSTTTLVNVQNEQELLGDVSEPSTTTLVNVQNEQELQGDVSEPSTTTLVNVQNETDLSETLEISPGCISANPCTLDTILNHHLNKPEDEIQMDDEEGSADAPDNNESEMIVSLNGDKHTDKQHSPIMEGEMEVHKQHSPIMDGEMEVHKQHSPIMEGEMEVHKQHSPIMEGEMEVHSPSLSPEIPLNPRVLCMLQSMVEEDSLNNLESDTSSDEIFVKKGPPKLTSPNLCVEYSVSRISDNKNDDEKEAEKISACSSGSEEKVKREVRRVTSKVRNIPAVNDNSSSSSSHGKLQEDGDYVVSCRSKMRKKLKRISSTPFNSSRCKRKLSSNSDETDEQENTIGMRCVRVRRSVSLKTNKRRSNRMCKMKFASFKELSSDESYEYHDLWNGHSKEKKSIFDDDSDFEPVDQSPKKIKDVPLKDVENLLPSGISNTSHYANLNDSDSSEECILPKKSHSKKDKQQKIVSYLSPIRPNVLPSAELYETTKRPKRKRPQTPNDWKRIKPRHSIRKEAKLDPQFPVVQKEQSSTEGMNFKRADISREMEHAQDKDKCSVKENAKNRKRKRKKKAKGVKLKLTKSGDNYEVSKLEESSDRSSSADPQKFLTNCQANESLDSLESSNTHSSKKKKKRESEKKSIMTPLRFTRHMSKDISVSPELFSKLIALSPEKKLDLSSQNCNEEDSCMIKQARKTLSTTLDGEAHSESQVPGKREKYLTDSPVQLKQNGVNDVINSEWTVQSIPGSPTLKTFIRKQKRSHSICLTPRIELSPLSRFENKQQPFAEPSLMSLVHLSQSPILNEVQREELSAGQASMNRSKPKSLRRLYRNRSGSKE